MSGRVLAEPSTYLVFTCGDAVLAVPAGSASEVLRPARCTRVPGALGPLLGVFLHRGELLPAFDLRQLVCPGTPLTWRRTVVLEATAGRFAIPVARIVGSTSLRFARSAQARHPDFVTGIADTPSPGILVLDVERLAPAFATSSAVEVSVH